MKLTDGERLLAFMLADLMEGLKIQGELDPSLVKTLICHGDEWAIKRKYQGLFPDSETDPSIISETTDILWMWGIIEHAISNLTGAEAAEAAGWLHRQFTGFDANNDEHYGVAQTLVERLDEFTDFKGRALNSHSQTSLPRYRKMYAKFDEFLSQTHGGKLTMDMLRELCA